MEKKIVFRASLLDKIVYFLFFVTGFLLFLAFIYNIIWRKPFSWVGTITSLGGTVFLIFQSITGITKIWSYRFELIGNTIKESYAKNPEHTFSFAKITGIRRKYQFNAPMAFINFHFNSSPSFSIDGLDSSGQPLSFEPAVPMPIAKIVLTFKRIFPHIIIDPAFAQDLEIWDQKKLFGKVNKERLFLLIFLSVTLIGIPLILVLYWISKGLF